MNGKNNKMKKLALAACLVLALSIFLAGCPAPAGVKPLEEIVNIALPEVNPACESCACFVCERGEQEIDDGVDLGALSGLDLSSFGGGTLKGGKCWFQQCNAELKKAIRDSNGRMAQKQFMVSAGSGTSWDFKQKSAFCPMADSSCFMVAPGSKERWQNVLRAAHGSELAELNGWLDDRHLSEEYERSPTQHDFYELTDGAGLPDASPIGLLCLFQGSQELGGYPQDQGKTAPEALYCSSGSCSKQRIYDSACRMDADGSGTIDYADNDGDGFPDDEVDCQCRTITRYTNDDDPYYERGVSNPEELIGSVLCHSNVPLDSPSQAPFVQQCGGTAEGTCVRSYLVGTVEYCLEWEVTDAGGCATDASGSIALNEYGICNGCLPNMDMTPIGEHGEWVWMGGDDPIRETSSIDNWLDRNIMPIINPEVSGWGVLNDPDNLPAIVLAGDGISRAQTIKGAGGCVPTFDAELNVYKQSCLVALDFGASPQPVPESVDILVNSISLSYCPLGGADFNVQILEPLIAQAKAVQAQNDRPIGWLLSVEFQENCPAAADMLMHSIAELSNAGYIGLMAPEVSGQPYSNFNDLPITPAPTASYAFFEGCADYYNGTRQTYYIRQNPQQCRCVPCDPSQELCTPFCGSSGLKCIGPTGLPAGDGATNLKCDAECVPFPDRTISYTDPGIDCSTIPELQKEENGCFALGYACQGDGSLADAMQGCYSICNVKTDLFADIDARVLNPAIPSARGLAEPEDGYASENSEGNLRYTPTTCYMQDYYSNFYNYQETQASSAFSQEYVIFDSKGEQNQCGRIDATGIFGDTAPCAAPDELPAVVIK